MKDRELYDFRFERQITIRSNQRLIHGQIVIGGVQWIPRHGCWGCKWSVSVIHPEETMTYGEDALHALTLAIRSVQKLILGAEEDGLEIWWLDPGDHCALSELGDH